MIISLDRRYNINLPSLQTSVTFSPELQTAFNFNSSYDINNIISEYTNVITTYIITKLTIVLKCIKSKYNNTNNTITIEVAPRTYSLSECLAAISSAINTHNVTGTINTTNDDSYVTINLNVNKVFNEANYNINMAGNILDLNMGFDTNITSDALSNSNILVGSSNWTTFNITNNNNQIRITPTVNTQNGNEQSDGYTVYLPVGAWDSIQNAKIAILAAFQNISFDITSFDGSTTTYNSSNTNGYAYGTFIGNERSQDLRSQDLRTCNISYSQVDNTVTWTLTINIRNALTAKDYTATFSGTDWKYYLYINEETYNFNTDSIRVVGNESVLVNTISINSSNQTFYLKPSSTAEGVYTSSSINDIEFKVPPAVYTTESLITKITELFDANPLTQGSTIESTVGTATRMNNKYTKIKLIINKIYTAVDYKLVFYDIYSFVYCNVGVKNTKGVFYQNITQDSTLGWIMGFRSNVIYILSKINEADYNMNAPESLPIYDDATKIITLRGDTSVNVNLYNYFLIVLDDYSLNKVDDGLITLSSKESTIKHPSYSTPVTYICDPVTNTSAATSSGGLTQKQIYSANAINDSHAPQPLLYSHGPGVADLFGLIPIKTSGMSNGQVYVDFSGTLQNQSRNYFGPTNIQRMTIRLLNDRGAVVNLNGADWSFSLLCDQLYTQPKS